MRRQLGEVWRNPNFVKLWLAHVTSFGGSKVGSFAIGLTAIITLNATPSQLGVLSAVWSGGAPLAALFAGPWVDRLPRRPLLVGSDIGRVILVASVPVAGIAGLLRIEQLYVVVFLVSALTVVFDVTRLSFLPALVQRKHLVEGNSALEASSSVVSIAAPGVAGVLVQVLTAPIAVVVDALSYFFSALFLGSIRTAEPIPDPQRQQRPPWSQVGQGFGLVFRHTLLRPIALSSATFVLFLQFFHTLRVLYLVDELGFSPVTLGILSALGSVGGVLGALLAGRATRRLGTGSVMIGGLVLSGVGSLMIPLAGGPAGAVLLIIMSGALLDGFGAPVYNINAVSLRQVITPDHLLGRVNAAIRFLVFGLTPLTSLLAGVLGELIGVRLVLTVAGMGQLLACVWVLLSPVRKLRFDQATVQPVAG